MVAAVAALCAATLVWGEQIGINGGQGWDGETYVRWARDFPRTLLAVGTTIFHAQRVLPSAIVWALVKLAGAKPTVPHAVLAFRLLDAALLVGCAALYAHLAWAMRWRRATAWVGFAALFACFANARHALYYPALTDTPAFALGLLMTWGYLLRHPIVVWACGLIAAFTWPALVPTACVMLLLPRLAAREMVSDTISVARAGEMVSDTISARAGEMVSDTISVVAGKKVSDTNSVTSRKRVETVAVALPAIADRWRFPLRAASAVLAAGAAAVFIGLAFHYLAHPVQTLGMAKFATWVRRDWLVATVPLLAASLVVSWYFVVDQPALWNIRAYVRTRRWPSVVFAVAGIAAIVIVRGAWIKHMGTQGPGPTGAHFLCQVTLEALRGPLWGLVMHVVYFGPIVAVATMCWPSVCRTAAGWGHGAAFALLLVAAFAAASESRQWIHLLPFLVAATLAATDARWTRNAAIAFGVLALAWSKLWLHIGYTVPGDWRVFPTQRYFMQLGPWASDTTYYVHAAAVAVTLGVLWVAFRGRRGPSASETQTSSSPAPPPP